MIVEAARWAAALLGAGFVLLGAVAACKPEAAARGYGLDAADADSRSWASAAGWRDAAIGAMILAVAVTAGRETLGAVVIAAATVAVGDVVVLARRGVNSPRAFAPHAVAAAAMVLVGIVLWTF